jgi:hypothetical protein
MSPGLAPDWGMFLQRGRQNMKKIKGKEIKRGNWKQRKNR